jgi:arylsulfatase
MDIMATCLDVADVSYPQEYDGNEIIPLEGKSLKPVFEGANREGHEALFWEHEGNRAVRKGDWKLVSDHPFGWELYNMKDDRTETDNLAGENPEKVKELSGMYEEWANRCGVEPWTIFNLIFPSLKNISHNTG